MPSKAARGVTTRLASIAIAPALMELVAQNDPSLQMADPVLFDPIDGTAVFGAKHFVYIFPMIDFIEKGSNSLGFFDFGCPAYDAGRKLFETLEFMDLKDKDIFRMLFWSFPAWVGMPMAIEGKEWLPENNPVRISVRINTPYKPGYGTMVLDTITDYVMNDQYDGLNPYYTFSTKGCEPTENVADKAENDLDLIKIVPNPYYAFSSYEGNALTHRVKITNVPDKCVVTIYTVNGTKIRQFKKDDATTTSIDWDLTNHANTPIASGIYLILVKDQTTGGERTVKFYCAMRPVDLNTF